MTDPIADLLTRIRNAARISKPSVNIPYSKIKEAILKVLVDSKFITAYDVDKSGKFPVLVADISDVSKDINLKRISSPGRRVYQGYADLHQVLNGYGISILSTPKGMMTNLEARKQKLGGEVICEVS